MKPRRGREGQGGARRYLSRREKSGDSWLQAAQRQKECGQGLGGGGLAMCPAPTHGSRGGARNPHGGGSDLCGWRQARSPDPLPPRLPTAGRPGRARMRTRTRRSGGRAPAAAAPSSTSTPPCRCSPSSTRRRPRAPTRWSPCWAQTGWWRSPTWSATLCGWGTPEWHAWWTAARWRAWSRARPPSR